MKKMKFNHPALHYRNPVTGEYNDDLFGEDAILVPFTYAVCSCCGGSGTTERTDIDCSRLVDSMREDGDDEGLEHYFQGGYDIVCPECHGQRVEEVPELPEWAHKLIDEWAKDEAEDRRYAAMERAMGA